MHPTFVSRLALACTLALSAVSIAALAGEAADTTDIEVVAHGRTEKLSIENLKVGETRQLHSEAGTLVTATRTADSLQLDIGGDKTSVPMVEIGELSDEAIQALIESQRAAGTEGRRVVRIHRADGEHAGQGAAHRKVVMLSGKDGELHEFDGEGPHVIVADGGEGKQVVVKRKVVKDDADPR